MLLPCARSLLRAIECLHQLVDPSFLALHLVAGCLPHIHALRERCVHERRRDVPVPHAVALLLVVDLQHHPESPRSHDRGVGLGIVDAWALKTAHCCQACLEAHHLISRRGGFVGVGPPVTQDGVVWWHLTPRDQFPRAIARVAFHLLKLGVVISLPPRRL